MLSLTSDVQEIPILGDPGAASLFEGQKSPWELTLTEPVPEIFKFVPLIGQKKYGRYRLEKSWRSGKTIQEQQLKRRHPISQLSSTKGDKETEIHIMRKKPGH